MKSIGNACESCCPFTKFSLAYHISCEVSKTPCEKPVQSYVITLFFLQLLNDTFHVKSMRNRYA